MAADPKRRRVRLQHSNGSMALAVGVMQYLGLGQASANPGGGAGGVRRHTRRSRAVPGEPVQLLLDNGETYTANVVGSMKAFESAYFVNRPAPKLIEATTQHGTIYGVKVD